MADILVWVEFKKKIVTIFLFQFTELRDALYREILSSKCLKYLS